MRERVIEGLPASCTLPTGAGAHNWGMCPEPQSPTVTSWVAGPHSATEPLGLGSVCPRLTEWIGPECAVDSGSWENLILIRFLARLPFEALKFYSCCVICEVTVLRQMQGHIVFHSFILGTLGKIVLKTVVSSYFVTLEQ